MVGSWRLSPVRPSRCARADADSKPLAAIRSPQGAPCARREPLGAVQRRMRSGPGPWSCTPCRISPRQLARSPANGSTPDSEGAGAGGATGTPPGRFRGVGRTGCHGQPPCPLHAVGQLGTSAKILLNPCPVRTYSRSPHPPQNRQGVPSMHTRAKTLTPSLNPCPPRTYDRVHFRGRIVHEWRANVQNMHRGWAARLAGDPNSLLSPPPGETSPRPLPPSPPWVPGK